MTVQDGCLLLDVRDAIESMRNRCYEVSGLQVCPRVRMDAGLRPRLIDDAKRYALARAGQAVEIDDEAPLYINCVLIEFDSQIPEGRFVVTAREL